MTAPRFQTISLADHQHICVITFERIEARNDHIGASHPVSVLDAHNRTAVMGDDDAGCEQ
jgi:hypothetical protein